ncbi:MAG: methionyl-tRNA formyltransferase [Candidatus Limnocylindrales bacterium]
MTVKPTVPATSGVPTVFLGTGPFGLPIIDALASLREVRMVGVVAGPPRPAGRGASVHRSPVALRAETLGLAPILEPVRLRAESAIADVLALSPELLVLADYGQLVPGALLARPEHGALNLHPSLLPRHRGASPVAATILAGDRQAGVTLMCMDEGLDTGPVVAQVAVSLDGAETAPQLEAWLAAEGAELLRSTIGDWLAGRRQVRPQPSEGVTMSRPLRREHGRLDPERDAVTLERQVRAYQPWPGTWCPTVAGRLIVWAARPLVVNRRGAPPDQRPLTGDGVIGYFVPDGDGLALLVADGSLRLDEVQLAGGRRMTSAALRRGHPELVGSRVGDPALP